MPPRDHTALLTGERMPTIPTFTEETAGPNNILIQQFDGFGPLGIDTGGF